MQKSALGAAYLVVVLICVSISVWTVFEGTVTLVGMPVAAGFSGIIGVGLLAADMSIRQRRSERRSILAPLAFLLVCIIASGPSHFNFFYFHAVGDRDARDSLELAHDGFGSLMKAAEAELEARDNVSITAATANRLIEDYITQVSLPEEQGHGPKAEAIFREISTTVGLTGIRPPRNRTKQGALAWLEQTLKPAIESNIAAKRRTVPLAIDLDLIRDIENSTRLNVSEISPTGDIGKLTYEQSISLIEQYEDAFLQVNDITTRRLSLVDRSPISFEAPVAPVSSDQVVRNHIAASLASGFGRAPYPEITAFAVAASLLIDLIPTLFVLLLSSGRDPEEIAAMAQAPKRRKRKRSDDVIEIN